MQEYIDFLGKQSPYDRLSPSDLERLSRHVEVEFFPAGAVIVAAHQPQLEHLYVVRTGSVEVADRTHVVDELGPGDTFGHLSLLSGLPPPLSVTATTDTLCYRVPDPRQILENPQVLAFSHYAAISGGLRLAGGTFDRALRPVRDFMRPPTWCRVDTPIREAARAMSEACQSCVIYKVGDEFGIMTDSDCRRRVATGEVSIDDPVHLVGTTKARVVDVNATTSEAFLEMVTHGVHHLVVVDPSGRAVGIARVFDLSSAEVRDPLRIRAAIDQAKSISELASASRLLRPTAVELFEAGIPAERASSLLGAMMEAVLERCISLEPQFVDSATGLTASWLVLGSLARREPLPSSDVDTALIWRAEEGHRDPRLLVGAADKVLGSIERCGLERCADGANASNPLFNRSESAWLAAARHWISRPDGEGALLLSSMLADSRAITGLQLGKALVAGIGSIPRNQPFLSRMIDEAIAIRPPTGFVRDFVVEAGGQHRGQLDLKRGGLRPVVALGRWIAVVAGLPAASTQDRLTAGVDAGLLTRDEADTLAGAYSELFSMLFRLEVEALADARPISTYINPESLDSLTRRYLRESFRAISRVQARVESEWVSRVR